MTLSVNNDLKTKRAFTNPKLSIIIPCYNTIATLDETLDSVLNQDFDAWEAIMVNDGSKDNLEEIASKWVEKDHRFKYYLKTNGGLGSARNYGIQMASGQYIMPLDSDNMIRPNFAKKAIALFESDLDLGVIYGNAEYFGDRTGIWKVGDFDVLRLLRGNYIDACAFIKQEVFENVGLYDEDIPFQGQEDWEFWLRVASSNYKFHYIDEIAFDYRVHKNSMIRSYKKEMRIENENYIKSKHAKLYIRYYRQLYDSRSKLIAQLDKGILWMIIKKIKKLK